MSLNTTFFDTGSCKYCYESMAEAAGLAFAILGAFHNAMQCFDYIQLAGDFDQDYQTATLKLDVARLRLSRWGVSVGLDRVDQTTETLPGAAGSLSEHEKAKNLLEQIVYLFNHAESQSATLKSPKDERNTGAYDATQDLDQAAASLHQKLERLSLKRFKPSNVLKKAKWALYKEKYLNRLIQDTTELIDGLIDLFPAAQPEQQRLCADEGTELAADENRSLIVPIIAEQDPSLSSAIQSQHPKKEGQTFNITFAGSQNHGLQQGYFSGQQTNNFGARS